MKLALYLPNFRDEVTVKELEDLTASAEELIEWTRDKLGAVKRVTSVDFADDLPTSALGKVLRREVRSRFWQDSARSVAGA